MFWMIKVNYHRPNTVARLFFRIILMFLVIKTRLLTTSRELELIKACKWAISCPRILTILLLTPFFYTKYHPFKQNILEIRSSSNQPTVLINPPCKVFRISTEGEENKITRQESFSMTNNLFQAACDSQHALSSFHSWSLTIFYGSKNSWRHAHNVRVYIHIFLHIDTRLASNGETTWKRKHPKKAI